jgi:hypothetical protein
MDDRDYFSDYVLIVIQITALILFAFWMGRKSALDFIVPVERTNAKDRIHG